MAKSSAQRLTRSGMARTLIEMTAQNLVGSYLSEGQIELRITEVEAYGGQNDSASHARFGQTSRNEPMFGPPGLAYVYLCYGIHQMLNVVVGPKNEPAAILIRSVEVISGLDIVVERRRQKPGAGLLTGPGKIGQALALDQSWNHHDLLGAAGLRLIPRSHPVRLCQGPRIGIDFAETEDRERCWRFADADSPAVKDKKKLILCS
ncbi:MAG: DNA-3-methyladenine glycosylase [Planctomycetota bacterium]|jgi:DNA-3-methyladenine glycosylase